MARPQQPQVAYKTSPEAVQQFTASLLDKNCGCCRESVEGFKKKVLQGF